MTSSNNAISFSKEFSNDGINEMTDTDETDGYFDVDETGKWVFVKNVPVIFKIGAAVGWLNDINNETGKVISQLKDDPEFWIIEWENGETVAMHQDDIFEK